MWDVVCSRDSGNNFSLCFVNTRSDPVEVCVCVYVCMRACVCVCMCVCVHACVYMCSHIAFVSHY